MEEARIRLDIPFTPKPPVSKLSLAGVFISLLASIFAVGSGMGTRWEIWNFRTGFMILRFSAFLGAAGAFLALAGLARCLLHMKKPKRVTGVFAAVSGVIIGALAAIIPYTWMEAALAAPPIHDITTDLVNPPGFSQLLPLRPTPAPYGGPKVAEFQREAYPYIRPFDLNIPYDRAFDLALKTAKQSGWKVLDSNRPEGRIEAVDETFWFGFKDDIAIRVTPKGGGARVDIRSVSRVGKSDAGTNARRISKYMAKLRQNVSRPAAESDLPKKALSGNFGP